MAESRKFQIGSDFMYLLSGSIAIKFQSSQLEVIIIFEHERTSSSFFKLDLKNLSKIVSQKVLFKLDMYYRYRITTYNTMIIFCLIQNSHSATRAVSIGLKPRDQAPGMEPVGTG